MVRWDTPDPSFLIGVSVASATFEGQGGGIDLMLGCLPSGALPVPHQTCHLQPDAGWMSLSLLGDGSFSRDRGPAAQGSLRVERAGRQKEGASRRFGFVSGLKLVVFYSFSFFFQIMFLVVFY